MGSVAQGGEETNILKSIIPFSKGRVRGMSPSNLIGDRLHFSGVKYKPVSSFHARSGAPNCIRERRSPLLSTEWLLFAKWNYHCHENLSRSLHEQVNYSSSAGRKEQVGGPSKRSVILRSLACTRTSVGARALFQLLLLLLPFFCLAPALELSEMRRKQLND